MTSNKKGFTLLEILVSIGIMSIGFLAMSQMQYLSFRQKSLAESGTLAANIVETVSNLEMANAKRITLLNARVYLDSQANQIIDKQDDYCNAGPDSICDVCPCNPLEAYVSDTFDVTTNGTEFSCAPVDIEKFDPANIEFFTNATNCRTVADLTPSFYIFRRVVSTFDATTTPNIINMDITYIVKDIVQVEHQDNISKMGTGVITDLRFVGSHALQNIQLSAHVERDWTNFINLGGGTWNEVFVPHIP